MKVKNLKLLATSDEDLRVIAAHLQDAIVSVQDIANLRKNRIFLIQLNRFMWEDVEKGVFRKNKRIRTILKFDNVINISSLKVINTIKFLPNGFRKEQVTPVDLILSKNSEIGYVALGRANHVGLFNYRTNKVLDYILVGKRAWGLALSKDEKLLYVANGLSDDISIIDTKKQKVIKSVKVGSMPYGILIVE